jgi:hypothetical protein
MPALQRRVVLKDGAEVRAALECLEVDSSIVCKRRLKGVVCSRQTGPEGGQFFGHIRPIGVGGAMERKRFSEEMRYSVLCPGR